MITIVVSITDFKFFSRRLLKSLLRTSNFRFIATPPDLTLAESYNTAEVDTKYICFVHQDVRFIDEDLLVRAEEYLDSCPNLGIAGTIGRRIISGKHSRKVGKVTRIPPQRGARTGKIVLYDETIQIQRSGSFAEEPRPVDALDDIILFVPKKVWEKVKFDLNFPFHRMGENYSLDVKTKLGAQNYIIPVNILSDPTPRRTIAYNEKHGDGTRASGVFYKKWGFTFWRK